MNKKVKNNTPAYNAVPAYNAATAQSMQEPIMPSQLPKERIDFSAISRYAKEHNICVAELSKEEKDRLVESVGRW